MINKDEIKNLILTENTAQSVLKNLRNLESNRERMQGRWIWELLQNARDASLDQDTNLIASVEISGQELIFQHNGRGFTEAEVGHLIFHGSTKVGDEITIGQYGSGFLTTHLLSPDIQVSGQLHDGRPFNFVLKREIGSIEALSQSMDRAWEDFDTSQGSIPDDFTTRFRYPLRDDVAEEGIETLRRYAPFVVVFNREFQRIEIKTHGRHTRFEVVERRPCRERDIQRVTVAESDNELRTQRDYIIVKGEHAFVAVPVATKEDGLACLPLDATPKLFLGFPLIGTENFSFPAIINSFHFTPTEYRDGVYLGRGENETNQINQAVFQEACQLHVKLIQFMAESCSANLYNLAHIPQIRDENWLNTNWIRGQLRKLVQEIRGTPSVSNQSTHMAPKNALVPLAASDTHVESLWSLMNDSTQLATSIPRRSEASGWSSAVASWADIEGVGPTSFSEGFDLEKLVDYTESETVATDDGWGTVEKLRSLLTEDVCAVSWLNRLYKALSGCGLDSLIRERKIVLDQGGYLDRLTNLYRDKDVEDELKNIADDVLGLSIRCQLRDQRLSPLANEVGKGDYDNEEALRKIIGKLRESIENAEFNDDFARASERVLRWVVAKRDWEHLRDFPAYSTSPVDGSREALKIDRSSADSVEIPLAPVKAWQKDLQSYAELFPWRSILATKYFDAMPDPHAWDLLAENRFVRLNVVMDIDDTVEEFFSDHPLPDGDHRSVGRVPLTDVAFLRKSDDGIMERVRGSQRLARLFWRFLTEYLVDHDESGLEIDRIECECDSEHNYFKAKWLVPIVNNVWVPLGASVRDRATAQSLAALLRDSDWRLPQDLSDENPVSVLLRAMNIARFDMVREFVVNDESSRTSLEDSLTKIVNTTAGDLSQVNTFVEDLQTDEGLPEILSKRRERVRIVRENQYLGRMVEQLVKDALEGQGFKVERTGIGSDFEIEYDLIDDVDDGEEIGLRLTRNGLSWLVEVKATRDYRAHMSPKQAETAVEHGNNFLLCVVPVGRDEAKLSSHQIQVDMRFVQNIGIRVKTLFEEFDALKRLRDDAAAYDGGDVQLEIEAVSGRIRVDSTVWQDGIRLGDLAARLA